MSDAVMVAIVSALGLVMSGVLVELIRSRKQQAAVVQALTPNGGSSVRDAIDRMERDVRDIRSEQSNQASRLAAVEAILNERGRA